MNDNKVIAGVLIGTVVILGGIIAFGAKSAPPPTEPIKVDKGEYIREDSSRIGSADAKVTIVEFGDFQCPACAQAEPILQQVLADYGDKVSLVFRQFPLDIHPNAELAARVSEAAGRQGKFKEMHDMLFANQSRWEGALNPEKTFTGYAESLGLDTAKFAEDIKDQTLIDKIRRDKGDGLALGVNATPTLFIDGTQVNASASALRAKIDAELAE